MTVPVPEIHFASVGLSINAVNLSDMELVVRDEDSVTMRSFFTGANVLGNDN